ncbi:hypothetical protein EDD16DRAFT_1645120 [Pisolithus croceorrhizus]|nr:hypothetical protein EDD16DRAFT_1645120 [Pisolithus croceorrhizus]
MTFRGRFGRGVWASARLTVCHALYFYMVKRTCLLRVTVVLITTDNQLWCANEFGVYCLVRIPFHIKFSLR